MQLFKALADFFKLSAASAEPLTSILIPKTIARPELNCYDREKLEPWFTDQMTKHNQLVCPDCLGMQWLEGPQGGMSINLKCGNDLCKSMFNLAFLPKNINGDGLQCVLGERIGKTKLTTPEV